MVGIKLLEGNLPIGIALIIFGFIGILLTILSREIIRKFFPVKLKIGKLTCWHIERPEPEHHGWAHCHEYNFACEFPIILRTEASITAFYIELLIGNTVLRVDYSSSPESRFPKIALGDRVANIYTFQVRLPNEIKVPPYGYVVLNLNRGKARKKAIIKVDDEYRPPLNYRSD